MRRSEERGWAIALICVAAVILALLLAGCGDLPTEPTAEEWPAWCDAASYGIEGQWGREFTSRGHLFRTGIEIAAVAPCEFAYAVQVLQQADEGHAEERMHLSRGALVITAYEQSGPVGLLTFEMRRTRQENRAQDGAMVADSTAQVFDTQMAKLWGEGLAIWGNLYTRKGNP